MQKNVFLEIEYDGTNYFGWQIQNRSTVHGPQSTAPTVQGELEEALKRLFHQKIRVIYAGRTDRGVHALGQVINFKVDTKIPLANIKAALNSFLAPAILIRKIKTVPLQFHARFSAKSKTYRYRIFNSAQGSVFERNYSWCAPEKLDIEKMEKCIPMLVGRKDFSLFARQGRIYHDCTRQLNYIVIRKRGAFLSIDINGDGFLRCMVRNIVAFLVRVGKGEIKIGEIRAILKKKKSYVNRPAPAQGLYLYKVHYE